MNLIKQLCKLLFVFDWNTRVWNWKFGPFFRVLPCIDLYLQSVLHKIKMKLNLLIIQQRSYTNRVIFRVFSYGRKAVSEFANYLIVLFFVGISNLSDQRQVLLSLKILLFVLCHQSLKISSLPEIRKFFDVNFDELNLLRFRLLYLFRIVLWLWVLVEPQQKVDLFHLLLQFIFFLLCWWLNRFFLNFGRMHILNLLQIQVLLLLVGLLNFLLLDLLLDWLIELPLRRRLLLFLFPLFSFSLGFELFLQIGQLLLFFGWMIEIAAGAFATVSLHVKDAFLPILFDMHERTVVFSAGATLKISAHLPSLHL